MKLDEAFDKAVEEGKKEKGRQEVVVPLSGDVTYTTLGCKHYLRQIDATTAECEKCGRGFYGVRAEEFNRKFSKDML